MIRNNIFLVLTCPPLSLYKDQPVYSRSSIQQFSSLILETLSIGSGSSCLLRILPQTLIVPQVLVLEPDFETVHPLPGLPIWLNPRDTWNDGPYGVINVFVKEMLTEVITTH